MPGFHMGKPTIAVIGASPDRQKFGNRCVRAYTRVGYDVGNPAAPVVLIDFSDFGCPYCARFTRETYPVLEREYRQVKTCAPYCTVGCVHRVAQVDELRQNPQATLARWFPPEHQATRPLSIRVLTWAFVTSPPHNLFRNAAARVFGARRHVRP